MRIPGPSLTVGLLPGSASALESREPPDSRASCPAQLAIRSISIAADGEVSIFACRGNAMITSTICLGSKHLRYPKLHHKSYFRSLELVRERNRAVEVKWANEASFSPTLFTRLPTLPAPFTHSPSLR